MLERSGMGGLRRSSASMFAVILGGLMVLASCHAHVLPRQLFTIAIDGADYPVMLSRTLAGAGGRRIEASSGTRTTGSYSSYVAGDVRVTTVYALSSQSEMPASMKLNGQVWRSDRWVQIDGAEFLGVDVLGYGFGSSTRQLTIHGIAYQ